MRRLLLAFIMVGALPLGFYSCSKDGGLNVFSIEDDKQLGLQLKQEIMADPAQFPVISRSTHPAAYAYIEGIRDEILATGKLNYADEFAWEVNLVKDDNIQNAFCTPGGYIYVYTGLIKYLDNASSLAGVMGHEMAHADERHSTEQMTKAVGLQALFDIALGNNQGLLTDLAGQLLTLEFSKKDESEADEHSVTYLCTTKYEADGAANFFEKIINDGGGSNFDFLSTHPSPDKRVENIRQKSVDLNCTSSISQQEEIADYNSFKNSI